MDKERNKKEEKKGKQLRQEIGELVQLKMMEIMKVEWEDVRPVIQERR